MSTPDVGLSLVVLRVADLEASRRFYGRLGLVLHPERHGDGPDHLAATLGPVVLELYPLGPGRPATAVRLGFTVPDPAAVAAALPASVVATVTRDGHEVVILRDPDANKVELTRTP